MATSVGEGRSNADIAGQLHMSPATVKAHVSRLLVKLDVDNRVQVALLVQDAGPSSLTARRCLGFAVVGGGGG